MRLSRLALLSPLLLLVACGGNPQTAGGPNVSGRFSGTDSSASATKDGSGALFPGGGDPARLKGLTPIQVTSMLGRPGFTRRDAPAEIWQYRGRACTLDLFLYDESGSQVVAHYDMRGVQPLDERGCFDELTRRGHAAPQS